MQEVSGSNPLSSTSVEAALWVAFSITGLEKPQSVSGRFATILPTRTRKNRLPLRASGSNPSQEINSAH
jgi:hypothetical protein